MTTVNDLSQRHKSATEPTSAEELLEAKSLEVHLAYVANLEATFTPLFKLVPDNRASVFDGGDPAVGSLMMWHFVEEIEHRSSGVIVCDHVVKNRWFRTRQVKRTFAHVGEVSKRIATAFDEHVPWEDRLVNCCDVIGSTTTLVGKRTPWRRSAESAAPAAFGAASTTQVASMFFHLALSQFPYHSPARQPLPKLAARWMREYDSGADMTTFATAG
jgi:hypothetical protein